MSGSAAAIPETPKAKVIAAGQLGRRVYGIEISPGLLRRHREALAGTERRAAGASEWGGREGGGFEVSRIVPPQAKGTTTPSAEHGGERRIRKANRFGMNFRVRDLAGLKREAS